MINLNGPELADISFNQNTCIIVKSKREEKSIKEALLVKHWFEKSIMTH